MEVTFDLGYDGVLDEDALRRVIQDAVDQGLLGEFQLDPDYIEFTPLNGD